MRKLIIYISILILCVVGYFVVRAFVRNAQSTKPETTLTVIKNLLPFTPSDIFKAGTNQNTDQPSTPGVDSGSPLLIDSTGSDSATNRVIPRMRHYTLVPTAGDIVLEREKDVIRDRVKVKEKGYYVRYIDRATGHIYEIKTDSETPIKISNTTIPKIYEATFLPSGNSLIARFLDTDEKIITYNINLKDKVVVATSTQQTGTTTKTVESKALEEKSYLKDVVGTYLTPDIKELALSPSGTKILELTYENNGGSFALLDNSRQLKPLTTLPLREWLLDFRTEGKALLTTKPSGYYYGYSYIFDTTTLEMKKVVGEINGLTVLPNKDLTNFVVGEGGATLTMSLLNIADNSKKPIFARTIPEKCVWSNTSSTVLYCSVPNNITNAIYPDDWYKSKISFDDSLWRIDTKTGEMKILSNFSKESGQAIDAINLKISPDETYITFINKKDLTLWGIDIAGEKNKPVITTETKKEIVSDTKLCASNMVLKNPVKFGSNNNPEDVKLLENFLNIYEGANLPVNGVYEKADYDAVVKWQEKYSADILTPWGITKGTGYISTTSLKKMREIAGECQ